MNLLNRLRTGASDKRGTTLQELMLQDALLTQSWGGMSSSLGSSDQHAISNNFEAYVQRISRRNGVVAAAVEARALVVSQSRFRWRNDRGELFGTQALAPLEGPSRPSLLHLAEQHVSYAGAAYFMRDMDRFRLLRPDFMRVVLGSNSTGSTHAALAYDWDVVGYVYDDGRSSPQTFTVEQVSPWIPEPDPVAPWRGESWITSVMREVLLDGQATDHLRKFYENAATPPLVFSLDASVTPEQAKAYAELVHAEHGGTANAYKNLMIGGGADVTAVGADLKTLDYKDTQGGHEARIASRSRVPAVVLGIREGMQGSALNSGNYSQTRRLWADGWFTPHVESLCAALEPLLERPVGGPSELTHDPSRVLFLQEDQKDAAEINQTQAIALRQLVEGGFDPTSAIEAVTTGDMSKLNHTGNLSVQLQPPGSTEVPDANP